MFTDMEDDVAFSSPKLYISLDKWLIWYLFNVFIKLTFEYFKRAAGYISYILRQTTEEPRGMNY